MLQLIYMILVALSCLMIRFLTPWYLEAGDRPPSRQDSLTSDTLTDPMFVEVELLSALSSPTAAEDDAPSPILGSRSDA